MYIYRQDQVPVGATCVHVHGVYVQMYMYPWIIEINTCTCILAMPLGSNTAAVPSAWLSHRWDPYLYFRFSKSWSHMPYYTSTNVRTGNSHVLIKKVHLLTIVNGIYPTLTLSVWLIPPGIYQVLGTDSPGEGGGGKRERERERVQYGEGDETREREGRYRERKRESGQRIMEGSTSVSPLI